jgi:small-conductance mechanosensitive channel
MDQLDPATWTKAAISIGIAIGIAIVLSMVVNLCAHRMERRYTGGGDPMHARRKWAATVVSVLRVSAVIMVWLVALLSGLAAAGVSVGPMLAAAGVGGIAIGFGAQTFVRDVISGLFVIAEGQYDVGDVIEVAGVSGLVEQITVRATVLRDLDGRRHVVPNGEIRVSTNHTKEFSRYLVDLPIPYGTDADAVAQMVRGEAEQMRVEAAWRDHITAPIEILGVEDYAESSMLLRFYVTTRPRKQWDVGRELRRRIAARMEEDGIGIPFPHREIIVRATPDGAADAGDVTSAGGNGARARPSGGDR